MTANREIRADYDRDSIVVYQAYNDAIADAALRAQRLVPPFSVNRMTWIKPSFPWMMDRCGWASKPNQERVLAIRIGLTHWEKALRLAVLTDHSADEGEDGSLVPVRVQWDPERSVRGAKLPHRSVQVGVGRALAAEYASTWITEIRDLTETARKVRKFVLDGDAARATALLPPERVWPAPDDIRRRLQMG